MRKIKLKEKSPEFDDGRKNNLNQRRCDISGCPHMGEYRAPKDRELKAYYIFCKDHVTDYNRAWNYFDGMSDRDIEKHLYESLFGHRPTWKYTGNIDLEEELLRKASGMRGSAENKKQAKEEKSNNHKITMNTPEGEALEIMGLLPPITLAEIKIAYKALAKQYHPDINRNNPEAEEKLKDINMAYTVLRLAYQKYEDFNIT